MSAARKTPRKHAKKNTPPPLPSGLSETEQDLLSHLQNGYELETDSLGGDPLLRRAKDEEAIRPLSATRNTVKALEERGLIVPKKSTDPLRINWRLNDDGKRPKRSRTKPATTSRRATRRHR